MAFRQELIKHIPGKTLIRPGKHFVTLLFIFILSAVPGFPADRPCLELWEEFSHKPEKVQLINWMKDTARNIILKRKAFTSPEFSFPAPSGCTGFFVTLIRKGKVRGCFGAFSHRHSALPPILKEYISGAIFLDPRHKPVELHELEESEIILTVTSFPEPVNDINNVDISDFGLFIDCENSTKTVIVPAEFRTASYVMNHTGISHCRFYRFRAVTIR